MKKHTYIHTGESRIYILIKITLNELLNNTFYGTIYNNNFENNYLKVNGQ